MARASCAAVFRPKPFRRGLLTAALLCSAAPGALAADWVDDGGVWSGNWNNPGHWSTGAVPGSTTPVVIGPTSALIQINTPANARSVQLLGGAQIVFYSGGNLVVTEGFYANGDNVRVTIQNSGTYLNIGGVMRLGDVTSFTVETDAELITGGAIIGENAGQSAGVSLFDGAAWDNFGHDLVVGQGGRGYVAVNSGSTLDTGTLTIGNGDEASEVRVSGPSTITVTGLTTVGGSGEGSLTVSGGSFSTGDLTIGDEAGSFGEAKVNDLSSEDGSLISYGTIRVGAAGTGELVLEGGGTAGAFGNLVVGESATGSGTILISGADSLLGIIGFVDIGDGGVGVLTVEDGGHFGSNNYVTLGTEETGDGTVSVTDGSWEQTGPGSLYVGGRGRGRFTLDNSDAQVNFLLLGDYETGDGGVTLTNGSTMDVATSGVSLGYEGQGNVRVEGGSVLTIGGGLRLASSHDTGRGELTISGTDSRVTVRDWTLVGNSGEGRVRVEAGGRLETANLRAGSIATGMGELVVTGDTSSWQATGDVWFGGLGQAELVLADQGVGIVTGNLTFGDPGGQGHGTLSVSNGAAFVGGTLTQHANSTYAYIIGDGPTAGGGVQVAGAATIEAGARLSVGFDGAVQNGDSFLVLDSLTGVTGTYTLMNGGQITAFLSVDAVYDPTSVSLVVSAADFATVGQTFNQIATAEGLDSLGDGNPLHDLILNIAMEDEARFAFDQLSGEVHASLKTALIEDTRFVRAAMSARAGDTAPGERTVLWGQGFGSWGNWDSDGNAAAFDRDTAGLLAGIDGNAGAWRVGVLAGLSETSFDLEARGSSGESRTTHLGVYAGTAWGHFAFRTGFAYAWHDIETDRTAAFPGFAETLAADYDAGTLQAFGEVSYRTRLGAGAELEPFLGLAHVRHHVDGFQETGGSAALSGAGQTTEVTFTTLGARLSHNFTLGTAEAAAWGMAGWRHAFGDTTPFATHVFAGGDLFTVAGVPVGKDVALIEAGLDVKLSPTAVIGLSYSGQYASGARDQAVKTFLNLSF